MFRHVKTIFLGFVVWILFTLTLIPAVEAAPPDFNGGVHNEYIYEEYVFLSGVPVKFSGEMKKTERETRDKLTTTYNFKLANGADRLTRTVTYESAINERTDKGQTTTQTTVTRYTERITLGRDTYTLMDYQFSHGTVIDNRPASDYYSGNLVGRKIYELRSGERVTVHFTGRNVGYENFWGSTETQMIDYEYVFGKEDRAFVTSRVSGSKSKFLQYEPHDPSLSSFIGGHARISEQDMIAEYTYNGLGPDNSEGTLYLNQTMVPKIERLIVPKFRDLAGHWSRDNIERLYSLGVIEEVSQFSSPSTPMNRYDFTVGVMKGADIRVFDDTRPQSVPRTSVFTDVDRRDPNYLFIESAVKKGVINGVSSTEFKPKNSLTRAQAVAILVRALGLEGRAPSPGYQTNYADNDRIPSWVKDSVYVATEIGLVQGDSNGNFNPNKHMSRAEAAALIVRFVDFLEKDLKQNYRDDMLF